MEKVPQIVSERLKAAAVIAEHPDADTLTAFAERSLAQVERTNVLDHLARCAECREVVALALPVSEPVQQVVQPSRGRRLRWPVLRWGLVAAGILVVGSFGVMQYRSQHAPLTATFSDPRQEAMAKKAENIPTTISNDKESLPERDKVQPSAAPTERKDLAATANLTAPSSEKKNGVFDSSQPTAGIHGAAPSRLSTYGPRVQWQQQNTNQLASNQNAPAQLQTVPTPTAPPPLAKQSTIGGPTRVAAVPASRPLPTLEASATTAPANLDTPVLQSQGIDQQPSDRGYAHSRVEKVKPASEAIMNPTKVIAADIQPPSAPAGAPVGRLVSTSPGAPIRWTINSAGGLQRSIDQGNTWQDVDVANSPAAAGANMALMKAPARAKESTYDSLKQKDSTSPLIFRAVAANGLEVWAGASGGLLYHSSDAGGHWTRVVPSAAGLSLTGDIVSLEFIDPQHGRVTTSTPEVWTTSDAGQSWQKQ